MGDSRSNRNWLLGGGELKKRLDLIVTERKLAASRSQARDLIKLGRVVVNGKICRKPGAICFEEDEIKLCEPRQYVSRGGEKLEKAYLSFGLKFAEKIVCDIGASTGGFTQFALKHGAKRVYAIDVGKNQLADILRKDERVVCMENFNARNLRLRDIGEHVDIVLCDVSFISLIYLLDPIGLILKDSGEAVLLIKPQFEIGKNQSHSVESHLEVIQRIFKKAIDSGLFPVDLIYSPITGSKGNIEYFAHMVRADTNKCIFDRVINIVEKAWDFFRGGKLCGQ